MSVPLRREKRDADDQFAEKLESIEDGKERDETKAKRAAEQDTELTIWLKDFPKTADDFKELRRSGAQHQPELEVAIHGCFMIEEDYKIAEVEDDAPIAGMDVQDSTLDKDSQMEVEMNKQEVQEFKKEDRIKAF